MLLVARQRRGLATMTPSSWLLAVQFVGILAPLVLLTGRLFSGYELEPEATPPPVKPAGGLDASYPALGKTTICSKWT